MHRIIDQIISATEIRVQDIGEIDTQNTVTARSLARSIQSVKEKGRIPVIAEVKPASPTTYNRDVTGREAAQIARAMEQAGAAAISVLTEPQFFHGSLDNLEQVRNAVDIPVLRKDFIINPGQIYEIPSDLILLIAGILGERLPGFIDLAQQHGLQPLVEVHNEHELMGALDTDAEILGINNRDLNTMEVDLAMTETLIPIIKQYDEDRIIISESGIRTPDDARRVMNAGADAILVGTSIMKGDIYQNTRKLVDAA